MRGVYIYNRREHGGWWWRLPLFLLLAAPILAPQVAAVVVVRTYARFANGLPEVPDLEAFERDAPRSSELRAADGTRLAELPFTKDGTTGHRRWVPYADIPARLRDAFLAAEDVRFFDHRGVDLRAVARAAWQNYRAGHTVEGASTLTQQIARNLLPVEIGKERSLRRKLREMILARRIERRWDKARIFETYANLVFLGENAYGVASAAEKYFGKRLDELSLAEGAFLAGLAQAPGKDPMAPNAPARARRDLVLDRMRRAGTIGDDEAKAALAEPIVFHPPAEVYGTIAPYMTELARQEIAGADPTDFNHGGLIVETTVLPATAKAAEDAARAGSQKLGARQTSDPPQVAVYLYDHVTGYVEAIVGGLSYQASRFDRATQSCRQPGSAFKPLVYGAAIEKNLITPGTALRDAPITEWDEANNVYWKPAHDGHDFRGVALAQDALAASLNAPAVDVIDRVGPVAAIELARRLGITSALVATRPLVLGASCVIPAQLARAFGAYATGGWLPSPIVVVRVRRGDHVLFDRASPDDPFVDPARRLDLLAAERRRGEPALDLQTAFLMTTMLAEVVRAGTAHEVGSNLGRPAAGKTGTTNRNTDAWFVGFTGRVVAAVWVGHDDPRHELGAREDGAHAAVPIWIELIKTVEAGRPKIAVPGAPPAGIVSARIDRETGFLAHPGAGNSADLYFRVGTVPTQTAGDLHDLPRDLDSVSHGF